MPPGVMTKQRDVPMTSPDSAATPFGCCHFFDQCAEDSIMSLHYAGGLPLLDWMGFNVSDVCLRTIEFINFVRPEQSAGACTEGYISGACDDPHGIEYGACKLSVEDFGRYGRRGPIRDIMTPKYYCRTDPRWRLDGKLVVDEDEWDMRFATDVLVQDISKHLIIGNSATAGQFDGLQQWVATGYDCTMLDSIVVNWNGNTMAGGAGITWNGAAVGAAFDFVNVLLSAYRRIRQRISWSSTLNAQRMRLGDMILVLPTTMAHCLLDFFTCWSVCAGSTFNPVIALQSYEARTFRDRLIGESPENMFGFGFIRLDSFPIPLLAYDYELITGATTGDAYFLTGAVGSNRIWEGEHLSATTAAGKLGGLGYFSTDGGRLLGKWDVDNECKRVKLWMHPRLFCRAPWAQIRFQDVNCAHPEPTISPDPCDASFYPETSPVVAECP